MSHNGRLRLCLAASGGGHLRQLLDLEPVWSAHDYFFVSEDTALSRSLAEQHPTHFLPHFALGQAKLGAPVRMALAGFRNFFSSARIMLHKRPHVVISTGAGSVFLTVAWARLLGAKIVVVESFARFDRPSLFSRMAAPLAHRKVVQSEALRAYWPDAAVFDPLKVLSSEPPEKEDLVFVTVGATLPFDRLIAMVAEVKARGDLPHRVLAQTGVGGLAPPGLETVETLPFDEVRSTLRKADIVVCHGGTGSLITALREGCHVIVVPRQFERGEHYDNHQAEITTAFAARGLVMVANSADELAEAFKLARRRPRVLATTDQQGLISHLDALLAGWAIKTPKRRAPMPSPSA